MIVAGFALGAAIAALRFRQKPAARIPKTQDLPSLF